MSIEPQIPAEWSDAERWAWGEIRAGRIADFHARYGQALDPQKLDGWDDEQKDRQLSQAFLVTILTEDSFRCATPFKGVRIGGACFTEEIDLGHARLERQLWLIQCRFHCTLNLKNLHVDGWLALEDSWFGGTFNLSGSVLESSVSLKQVKIVNEVDLVAAKIGGSLVMNGSTFDGKLKMNSIEVGQALLMREKAAFKEVDMVAAKIGSYLDMDSSTFDGKLDMKDIDVGQALFMRQKATFKEVDLVAAKIGHQLSMNGSTFDGKLNMNSIEVGQALLMSGKATFKKEIDLTAAKIGRNIEMNSSIFKEVDLKGAKISGQLSMNGSTFEAKLAMNGTEVGEGLFMREKAAFKEVDLGTAKIGGSLDMNGSTFDGELNMNSIEVSQALLMREKAAFKEVDLVAAKIGGYLDMDSSTFDGKLDMGSIEVGRNFFARSTTFPTDEEVILHFARIGSNLDLSGATIGAIDLTATTITGELRLGSARSHKPTIWVNASRMILRNTIVGTIQDAEAKIQDIEVKTVSWPTHLELEGFIYRRLGGYGAEGTADIATRDAKWFIKDWLDRDKTFSPSPYEQLANVLYKLGYPSKANAIRYEARKRWRRAALERREGKRRGWPRWIGLTLLQYTIGYGIGARYFRVLWWFGGITLIGFLVLLGSIDKSNWDLFKMAWASFDQVLPFVKLNEEHEKLILENCSSWTISYFYVQELIGYVLGGFLGAGLAGLTQKS